MTLPPPSSKTSLKLQALKDLFPYLWPKDNPSFKLRFLAAFLLLILAKVTAVLIPLYYKKAVDVLSGPGLLALPLSFLLIYGLIRVISLGCGELRDALFAKIEQSAAHALTYAVFKHLHTLSLRFHLERKTGALSKDIERGAKSVENIIRFLSFNILPTLVEILLACGILLILYPWYFAAITLLTMVIYVWSTLVLTEWRTPFVRKMNSADSEGGSLALDSLINYKTVKYFCNEELEAKRYDVTLDQYEAAAIKSKTSLFTLNAIQGIIIAIGVTLIMVLAAQKVVEGTMTIGDFVLVNAYLVQLYLPLNMLGFAYRQVKQALVDMENLFTLLKKQPEIVDPPNALSLNVKKGEIVFENVTFGYRPDRLILKGISFNLPAGKTVAVVGPSGAGKSTLARLLFRFYEPFSGHILIDHQDIAKVTQESLRKALGIVPQDTVLFNDTLFYNIHYGKPEASAQEVERAARLAHLDHFIEKLPEKYETLVGERGLKLSGGEKQRVAIARVLLKHPKIFVFDEATSSLDTHTEKEIQQNIQEVSKNYTTLIIAHRLSTIIQADKIMVLNEGRIVESGTHKELIALKGLYATLWMRQQEQQD